MIRATKRAIAAERIAYGAPVFTIEGKAFPTDDLDQAEGIAHRSLLADAVEPGQPFNIVIDGGLLAFVRNETRWAVVTNGKVKLND